MAYAGLGQDQPVHAIGMGGHEALGEVPAERRPDDVPDADVLGIEHRDDVGNQVVDVRLGRVGRRDHAEPTTQVLDEDEQRIGHGRGAGEDQHGRPVGISAYAVAPHGAIVDDLSVGVVALEVRRHGAQGHECASSVHCDRTTRGDRGTGPLGPSATIAGEMMETAAQCDDARMSEEGWRAFLAARPDDWAVLHGGATATYAAGSLRGAATLAAAVADIAGLEDAGALLTLGDRRLTVRLTRGLFMIEPHHLELARQVSSVAREHGATADRTAVHEVQVAVAARRDEMAPAFWRAVLGYDAIRDDNGCDPLGHGSTVWLQELDPAKPLRHALHIDVSVPRDQAASRLAAALAAGGRLVGAEPDDMWILADPAGNKVCLCVWPDTGA